MKTASVWEMELVPPWSLSQQVAAPWMECRGRGGEGSCELGNLALLQTFKPSISFSALLT